MAKKPFGAATTWTPKLVKQVAWRACRVRFIDAPDETFLLIPDCGEVEAYQRNGHMFLGDVGPDQIVSIGKKVW